MTRLITMRTVFVILAVSAEANAHSKAKAHSTRQCQMTSLCNAPPPQLDCTRMQDNRSCTTNVSLFGITLGTQSDPVCEAAKAAQNSTYQVQSQACEARRAAYRLENEWKRQTCLLVADACSSTLPMAESSKFAGRLLWVDDHPDNNMYERIAFKELGATIEIATDTTQAMAQLMKPDNSFDVVVSDFARADDPKTAYTLLEQMRKLHNPPPVVIYSTSSTKELATQAIKERKAFGETSEPKELMNLVIRATMARRQHAALK